MSRLHAHLQFFLRTWPMPCLVAFLFALPVLAADGMPAGAAQQSLDAVEQIYRKDGPEAALPAFEDLRQAFVDTGDSKFEAVAVRFVGESHWRLGDYPQADEHLQRALVMNRELGERPEESKTLNLLGLLHWDLGEFDQAQAYFREGSAIAAELGDRRLQGAILNNLSLVHDELGDYYVSLEQYQRALDLYEGIDFPRGEGDTLGNMGGVYMLLGRYQQALDHYQRALAISTRLESVISMSQDHGNVGLCYLGLGRVDAALEHLGRAVELSVRAGMQQDKAFWLAARGNAQQLKGRYDLALEDHRAALALYEQIEGKTESVEALHEMGRLYLMLGDSGSAEKHYQRSMELARAIGLPRGVTRNLLALGDLQLRQGQFAVAAELYRGAVERASDSGEMVSWSEALLRLAAVHRDQQHLAAAAETSAEALEIARKTGAPGLVAHALYARAELDRLQHGSDAAVAGYNKAMEMLARSPDPELEWQVHYGKGLALADAGNRAGAIIALESSVSLIEGVRDRLHEERFKAGYVQDKYQVYVDLVRLQLEAGREQEAFSTAERLRSRSYLDLVETGGPADASADDDLLEFTMQQRIRTLREALAEETNRSRPEQRQLAIEVYSKELLAAEQEYQALLDDQRSAVADGVRTRVPSYGQVRTSLEADEALVEYVVDSESVMVFVLTRRALVTATMPIRREDLENKVELVRALIRSQDNERWKKPAASLSSILVDPVMASGQMANIHHLYLVPHGKLNYLPFALLPSHGDEDDHRLVEDFMLAYLPTAAALLRDKSASANTSTMLAMAPAASRLQFAFEEARVVNTLFVPDSRALLGSAATESSFKQLAPQYRVLHLATHGYFNKLNPLLSGVQLEADLTNDGRLELHEILGLRLDADLVTLSACQTGLGSGYFAELPAGDDFVGLTRAFLYAGSTAVLATLWEVDDASTLALMKHFYGGLRQVAGAEDMANALALAQRALLSSKQYKHPYFWAPFVLVGEMGRDSGQQI